MQWPWSSAKLDSLKLDEELKNLQKLLRQLKCLWSFGTWRDAQVLRTLPEELRVLRPEEFEQPEELGQLEEIALVALRRLAERALKKNLALRALLKKVVSWLASLA